MAYVVNDKIQEYNTSLLAGYQQKLDSESDESWKLLFETGTYGAEGLLLAYLSAMPGMVPFGETRQIKHIKEKGVRLTGETYESTIGVSVNIINDGLLSSASKLGSHYGDVARSHPPEKSFGTLKSNAISEFDGKPFFAQDHNMQFTLAKDGNGQVIETVTKTASNDIVAAEGEEGAFTWYLAADTTIGEYKTRDSEEMTLEMPGIDSASDRTFLTDEVLIGLRTREICELGCWFTCVRSNKPLTYETLKEAKQLLESYTNSEGRPLSLKAKYLVVPSAGEEDAASVIGDTLLDTGKINPMRGKYTIISSKYLD